MEAPAPETIFWAVLAFMWAEFLWEGYIGRRQRKVTNTQIHKYGNTEIIQVYRETTEVPADLATFLDQETFTKARLYALEK
jgi:hypothetical protein